MIKATILHQKSEQRADGPRKENTKKTQPPHTKKTERSRLGDSGGSQRTGQLSPCSGPVARSVRPRFSRLRGELVVEFRNERSDKGSRKSLFLMCTDAAGEAVNAPRALCTTHNSHVDAHTPPVSQLLRFSFVPTRPHQRVWLSL